MMNVGQNKGSSMGAAVAGIEQGAIFQSAGQAVHVAFLIMGQEPAGDAPFRKALIRAMESIQLDGQQRDWLDQLRGASGGSVNFAGLQGAEIRAQCAMITQAVRTKLPAMERWVLEAKYGQVEFEDIDLGDKQLPATEKPRLQRRYAFNAERIAAIHGLSDWLAPLVPNVNRFAIDFMLGQMYANHKRIEISTRDLAAQFGGSHMIYFRASGKIKHHLKQLEAQAIARLEPLFVEHGVCCRN